MYKPCTIKCSDSLTKTLNIKYIYRFENYYMYLGLSCMRKPLLFKNAKSQQQVKTILKGYNFVIEIQKFHPTDKYSLRDREPKGHVCIGRKW